MDTWLVAGGSGFLGRHVLQAFQVRSSHVVGLSRRAPSDLHVPWIACDMVREPGTLRDAIATLRPTGIVHLAANNSPVQSDSWTVLSNNLGATFNLLAACETLPATRVLVVSSSAVYGEAPSGTLVAEDRCPAPVSTYGVSKAAVESLALQQGRRFGVPVVVVRPFNLTGPGEPTSHVTSAFARQVALAELGHQPPVIRVGNLNTTRDFVDVRDAAEAIVALATAGRPGEVYNVCSGSGSTPRDVLATLCGLATTVVAVEEDPTLARPVEILQQIGDPTKTANHIGWRSKLTLAAATKDLLAEWRLRVRAEGH